MSKGAGHLRLIEGVLSHLHGTLAHAKREIGWNDDTAEPVSLAASLHTEDEANVRSYDLGVHCTDEILRDSEEVFRRLCRRIRTESHSYPRHCNDKGALVERSCSSVQWCKEHLREVIWQGVRHNLRKKFLWGTPV